MASPADVRFLWRRRVWGSAIGPNIAAGRTPAAQGWTPLGMRICSRREVIGLPQWYRPSPPNKIDIYQTLNCKWERVFVFPPVENGILWCWWHNQVLQPFLKNQRQSTLHVSFITWHYGQKNRHLIMFMRFPCSWIGWSMVKSQVDAFSNEPAIRETSRGWDPVIKHSSLSSHGPTANVAQVDMRENLKTCLKSSESIFGVFLKWV